MQKPLPPDPPASFEREDRILGRMLSGALIAVLLFFLIGAVSHAPGPTGATPQSFARAGAAATAISAAARAPWRQNSWPRDQDPFSPAND
jgi:hypothetical protein